MAARGSVSQAHVFRIFVVVSSEIYFYVCLFMYLRIFFGWLGRGVGIGGESTFNTQFVGRKTESTICK